MSLEQWDRVVAYMQAHGCSYYRAFRAIAEQDAERAEAQRDLARQDWARTPQGDVNEGMDREAWWSGSRRPPIQADDKGKF